MKSALAAAAAIAASLVLAPTPSRAWEATTTHAGLAERAALASSLHARLESLGFSGGLFSLLTVPPPDAPALIELLRKFNPTHGFVPDARGRQTALSWLAAGAAAADSPPRFAGHHFLDPSTGRGLDQRTLTGLGRRARHRIGALRTSESVMREGVPAHQWVTSRDNPLGHQGFVDQYARAIRSRTPGERERHLAGALVAAGAILHALQDLASPSHVRIDLAAHLDPLGASSTDVGSRLERIAALGFGRLGVPAPKEVTRKDRLESFFLSADGSGLSQRVAARFYSRYTVPKVPRLKKGASAIDALTAVQKAIGRSGVKIQQDGGLYRVTDERGTCLVLFEIQEGGREVVFSLDDPCVLSQLQVLLPLATGYGAGALEYLFRGVLDVKLQDGLSLEPALNLGDGVVEAFWDDATGVRKRFFRAEIEGGALPAIDSVPSGASRVTVLYTGTDARGEPLVAAGSVVPGAE